MLWRKSPVPQSEQVSVVALAKELHVDPPRVQALIDRGYLRVMFPGMTVESTLVARPLPAAFAWLQSMFAPLRMRPMYPVAEVARLLGQPVKDLRGFCVHYNLPLHDDPIFGELISLATVHKVLDAIHSDRLQVRFDSQAMLFAMAKRYKLPGLSQRRSFSYQLEKEISRLCHVQEPDRTIRAAALYHAYMGAKNIKDCLLKYHGLVREMAPRERRAVRNLEKMLKIDIEPDHLPSA